MPRNVHVSLHPSLAWPGKTPDTWHSYLSIPTTASTTQEGIVDQYGTFSLAQFRSWNGSTCTGLWLGYWYCVGVPGTPTTQAPAETCNPSAPTPTQPGAACACKRWHSVGSGQSCDSIIRQYGITANNSHLWNPQVGRDCKALWLGYYVCVGR